MDFNAQRRAVLDDHVNETLDLAGDVRNGDAAAPDLVIWPENSSDIDPYVNEDAAAQLDRAARGIDAPILVGAVVAGPKGTVRNRAIVWDPSTGPGQTYDKRHPVPFAEYIPDRSFFRHFSDKVDLVRTDFSAGSRPGDLSIGGARIGDAICFEVVYDGLVRDVVHGGAGMLVVQTNNATFGFTDESAQQLAMSRLRAVENGRAVLQVATTGKSAVIGPDGGIRAESGALFTPDLIVSRIPLRTGRTLATRVGAGPEYVLAALAVLATAFAITPIRRRLPRRAAAQAPDPKELMLT